MSESRLLNQIRRTATAAGARLFRNQVGLYVLARKNCRPCQREGTRLSSGLAKGSADLIGWTPVAITPDMVGSTVAVFTSIEAKTATGRMRVEQVAWDAAVRTAHGISGVAHSPEDALRIIKGGMP